MNMVNVVYEPGALPGMYSLRGALMGPVVVGVLGIPDIDTSLAAWIGRWRTQAG